MNELLRDDRYLKIRKILNEPNIFLCLKNASYEIRHSNFIAWLLDPKGSHGEKDFFLRLFLKSIGEISPKFHEEACPTAVGAVEA